MAKIFITGITGFLGSNIAAFLIEEGHDVIATYRAESSRNLNTNYINRIDWVLQDGDNNWVETIIHKTPEVIIHAAWLGVGHESRNNWEQQFQNIAFLNKILIIAAKSNANKVICLGSQAEYGNFNGSISESHPLNPTEAYGRIKVISSEIVKQYCSHHGIDWYWLRLFSFFGKGESENWLIPSLVKKLTFADQMDLTPGEQQYSYLFVNDLGLAVNKLILNKNKNKIGIYNISGKKLMTLKSLVENIRDKVNPKFKLNFGKLPYRESQTMHMQGNSSKFINDFGEFDISDFDSSILTTVEYLKEQFRIQKNESI